MIYSYLKSVFENVPQSVSITSITDNADGTYTIAADTTRIRENTAIVISDTSGFNAEYRAINVTDTGFDISKESGEAIPGTLGTVKNYVNYVISSFKEAQNKMISEGYTDEGQAKRMPLIMCNGDIDESQENGIFTPVLEIYLIINTNQNDSIDTRNSDTMSFLRILESDLIKSFNRSTNFFAIDKNYNRQEIFYDGQIVKQETELPVYVDMIKIEPGTKYIISSNCN